MSEIYVDESIHENTYNYSEFNQNRTMLEFNNLFFVSIVVILIFILLLILVIIVYYFRESIKLICYRPIRKHGKIILMGEMTHKISNKEISKD